MTEPRAPYWTASIALDAHIRDEACPNAPLVGARNFPISEEGRRLATQVLERSYAEVARRLRLPPRAFRDDERRAVQLWDLVEFSVAIDGTDFRAHPLSDDPGIGLCPVTSDLWHPIGPARWMAVFEPVIAAACREVRLDPRTLPGPIAGYIRSVMGSTFRKCVHWNHLRRTVLEFLRPDTLTCALTRRIFDHLRPSLDSFNWTGRHARELALVAIDHPRLLPFLQHVSSVPNGCPLENFRRAMEDAGMTPSAFRKLERWGHECFVAATAAPLVGSANDIIARFANLLERLQVEDDCPPVFGQIVTMGEVPFPPDWFLRAALAEVLRLGDDDPDDCWPLDLEDAMRWLASKPPDPDENQRRAGWDWISAQAWKHRLATDAEAARPWAVPCAECVIGNFRVVPLRSRIALREEGEKMRNCLANFGDACASGKIAVFSIRDAAGKVRAASFSLEKRESSWSLVQIAGKANARVPEELKRIALAVASNCNGPSAE